MRNILLTFFATASIFLGAAVYMQANSMMIINTGGIQVAGEFVDPYAVAELD